MSAEALVERMGRHVPAGTVLFREGDAGNEMFVVHSGRVELTRRLGERVAHLCYVPPGEFFGEMAIVNHRPRSATATMVEEGWQLVIDPRTLETMLRARSEVAVRMIQLLAARLERANQQIELLVLEDADHRVVRLLSREAQSGVPHPQGWLLKIGVAELAGRTGLDEVTVREILGRLEVARLLLRTDGGVIVPELGKLADFLEFLELKERFAH